MECRLPECEGPLPGHHRLDALVFLGYLMQQLTFGINSTPFPTAAPEKRQNGVRPGEHPEPYVCISPFRRGKVSRL